MIRRYKKTLLLSLLLVGAVLAFCIWLRPEPSYQGKRLDQWVSEMATDPDGSQGAACRTLCQAGPIAVPALLDGLHKKDDSRFYTALWPRLPAFLQRRLARPVTRYTLRYRCAYVLGCIEPSTPKIVRELRHALTTGDAGQTTFAAQALRMIAEREPQRIAELERSLPELRQVATVPGEHTGLSA
jgi:hypothetical protein